LTKGFKDSKGKFRPIGKTNASLRKKTVIPSGIPIYDTHVNFDDKRKPFIMWVVKHPEKPDRIKDSETIVMAEHYGQAIDDFITSWNKQKRKKHYNRLSTSSRNFC